MSEQHLKYRDLVQAAFEKDLMDAKSKQDLQVVNEGLVSLKHWLGYAKGKVNYHIQIFKDKIE